MADKDKGRYVPIFLDWLDQTQDLTPEEKGNLIDAIISYASGLEYEHLLTGGCRIAFRFLKGQVDRNKEISEKRSKAASKQEETETNENKEEQNETNENKPEQKETNLPKEKEEEEENNNNNKNKEKEKDENKSKKFVPPSVDEVRAFCQERGNNIDPEYFIAYNENRNWTLSNGRKMKDWKLAVITWEKNNFSKPQAQGTPRKVVAQQYSQRDYSTGNDADNFDRLYQLLESG